MNRIQTGRYLIPLVVVVAAAVVGAVLLLPALVGAQLDPTVEAAVQAAFTQTAEAEPISTEAFGQTVDAAIIAARTATAQAQSGGGAVATQQPPTVTPIPQTPETALNAPVATTVAVPVVSDPVVLSGHEGVVNAVDITDEGRVASAGEDGFVVVHGSGDPLRLEHDGAVLDVAFNSSADEIISTGADGRVYRWDAVTGEALPVDETFVVISGEELPETLASQGKVITGFSDDGSQFATFDFNGLLGIWQYPDVQASFYPTLLNYALVGFNSDNVAYTTQDAPDTVQIAPLDDLTNPTQQFEFVSEFAEPIAFSSDGTRLLVLGSDGTSSVVDLQANQTLFTFEYTGLGLSAFSPDGSLIADGGSDGALTLFDGNTGESLISAEGHSAAITEVTFNPAGTRIASAGEDGNVLVWTIGTPNTETQVAETGDSAPTPLPEGFPPITRADVAVAEQVFEGGRMFWVEPVNQIWVMIVEDEGSGRWLVYDDTFDEDTDMEEDPNITAPEGLIEPVRGFGKLWRENPTVQDALGWAITPEFGYPSRYTYVPGGEIVDGEYVAGPGFHTLFSLNSEEFRFNEANGTWQLGS